MSDQFNYQSGQPQNPVDQQGYQQGQQYPQGNYQYQSPNYQQNYSTPQGNNEHMTVGNWIVTYLLMLIPVANIVLMFVWAFAICYAQVYVGVHFPLDVICGAIVGVIIGYIPAKIFNTKIGLLPLRN